ncbi:MAG: hypothetical protein HY903_22700 [Deltaproteobacteria bacterium]|nr:hypothetical protein [Deltaproteobacteria bacterium]
MSASLSLTALRSHWLKALLVVVLLGAVVTVPAVFAGHDQYLGDDAFSLCGIVELTYRGLEAGDVTLYDLVVRRHIVLRDLVWPDGFDDPQKAKVDLSMMLMVLLRHVVSDANAAYLATLMLYLSLNVLAVFLVLKKVFRLADPLAAVFAVLPTTYPYFYYRLGHLTLFSFWQELLFIGLAVAFIERPRLHVALAIAAAVYLNLLMDPQTSYYLALSATPALLGTFADRLRALRLEGTAARHRYLADLALFSALVLAGAAFIYDDFHHKLLRYLPSRPLSELHFWRAPIHALWSPPYSHILFRAAGGRPPTTGGYFEKAIYLGDVLGLAAVTLAAVAARRWGAKGLAAEVLCDGLRRRFALCGGVVFLTAVLVSVAPALRLDGVLYFFNQSGRVYARAISLAIVFLVVLFAVLVDRALAAGLVRSKLLVVSVLALIVLDTWPADFTAVRKRFESRPLEYTSLAALTTPGEVLLDHFGRDCLSYGFIFYKPLHALKDFNFEKVEHAWGAALLADLRRYGVDYVLFCKHDRPHDLNLEKIRALATQFALPTLFETDRALLVRVPR